MKVTLAAMALLAGLLPFTFPLASGASSPLTELPQEVTPQESPSDPQEAIEMAELFVRVVDEDGEPVFKASVRLNTTPKVMEERRKSGERIFLSQTEQTDPEGEAILELEPGEGRTLSVSCRDLSSENLTVEITALKPGESRDVELVLRTKDDAVFQARVVDDVTGQPVPDVEIQEQQQGGFYSDEDIRLKRTARPLQETKADGTFETTAATWRRKTVTLLAPGYAPARCIVGGADGFPGQDERLEVRLKLGSSVNVELKSAPANTTVKVTFYNTSIDYHPAAVPGTDSFSSFQIEGVADATGASFVVHDVPPGAEATTVVSAGRQVLMERRFTPAKAGESLSQSLDLSRDGAITGVLRTVDGEPVPDYELVIVATTGRGGLIKGYDDVVATATTAADGSFSFSQLTSRMYKIGAQLARKVPVDAMIIESQVVDLSADVGEVKPLEMVLMKGMSIRGRIVGPDGKSCRGHVYVSDSKSGWSAQTNTKDEDEFFEVGPLTPGTYEVRTSSAGGEYATALHMQVLAGATDVLLELREAGSVTGRIVDAATGEPIGGRVSYMQDLDGSRIMQGYGDVPTSDFKYEKVAAGQGYVIAEVEGVGYSPVTAVTIRPGETTSDVVLKVSSGATVAASSGSRIGLQIMMVDVGGYRKYSGFTEDVKVPEVVVPAGKALVTFMLKDSEDSYQISVEAKPGEVVQVNADDAKFVPAPVVETAAPSENNSQGGDSSPQPKK